MRLATRGAATEFGLIVAMVDVGTTTI